MTDAPEPKPPPVVAVTDDPVVRTRLERAARDMQAILLAFRSLEEVRVPAPPRVYVVDLRLDGAPDAIRAWKAEHPDAPVVGVLAVPRPDLWTEAETAGADLVTTHGTIHRALPDFLRTYTPGVRRIRVASLRDFEGRLGLVGRLTEGVPEEIAFFHVGYDICAVGNSCPHAGARLSEGELEGSILTCPRHGSQFDVRTGERVRGPADDPIPVYAVVVEDGTVFVEVEGA